MPVIKHGFNGKVLLEKGWYVPQDSNPKKRSSKKMTQDDYNRLYGIPT